MALKVQFDIDAARKHRLLNGLDEIGLTMQMDDRDFRTFESERGEEAPLGLERDPIVSSALGDERLTSYDLRSQRKHAKQRDDGRVAPRGCA